MDNLRPKSRAKAHNMPTFSAELLASQANHHGAMKALLLIDIQEGLEASAYYGWERNNRDAEANARKILEHFRDHQWPVFHIQHCSTDPESPLHPTKESSKIKAIVSPGEGEPVVSKTVNSAFIGTDLESTLNQQGITEVFLVGLTTDHCVSTTARMAANLGFRTNIISDATATFDKVGIDGTHYTAEIIHLTALASLKDEFATILTTQDVLEAD